MKLCLSVLLVFLSVSLCAAALPVFPNDFTSNEATSLLVFQGQYSTQSGQYCCSPLSNCEVQTQYQNGKNYYDYTNNRTRFDDFGSGQSIVSFFNDLQKECLINVTTMECIEYCPLDGESLDPGFVDPNATDMGQRDCHGNALGGSTRVGSFGSGNSFVGANKGGAVGTVGVQTCELFEWKEVILGVIVMETDDVYVDLTDPKNPVPVRELDTLTPFGQLIGYATTTYNNFQAGTPSAALFDVKGVDSCPQSQNCGNNQFRNMRRIRNKLWKTYLKHKGTSPAEAPVLVA